MNIFGDIYLNNITLFRNNVNLEGILLQNIEKMILKNFKCFQNNENLNFSGGCFGSYNVRLRFLFNIQVVESYSNTTTVGVKIIDDEMQDLDSSASSLQVINFFYCYNSKINRSMFSIAPLLIIMFITSRSSKQVVHYIS